MAALLQLFFSLVHCCPFDPLDDSGAMRQGPQVKSCAISGFRMAYVLFALMLKSSKHTSVYDVSAIFINIACNCQFMLIILHQSYLLCLSCTILNIVHGVYNILDNSRGSTISSANVLVLSTNRLKHLDFPWCRSRCWKSGFRRALCDQRGGFQPPSFDPLTASGFAAKSHDFLGQKPMFFS